ncbi:pilus assembly protein TadG-related protein [Cellulomonas cellasea]|uniref:Putative Flp pilus-assembly TadG-like N-terminal domain-containing protein n=1 Tax=Cellulomonas cellasea TaxID=43670 RepID=A0A7W4UF40_9CELL|nr:pilus assembly protein TadG-related protein [Cellulomonas cellasea]MBB2922624.1 hypothetical protein [Cellulomonas cellasea]
MTARSVDLRGVGLFVLLDLVTYAAVYWLIVPALEEVLATLDPTTLVATGHVLTAVRLTFIGAVVTRAVRSRRGLANRTDIIPTIVVAAVLAWGLQTTFGVAALLLMGLPAIGWDVVVALVEWVAFGLLGAMFVTPGEAMTVPLRYRVAADDRGSVNMFLVPATVALVFVTLLAIVVIGSGTNDRREATTAADAAALAAVQEWEEALEGFYLPRASASQHASFWSLAGTPLSSLVPSGAMEAEAAKFAARNDATLLDLDIDVARAEVRVRVRNDDTVPHAGSQVESTASAALEFRSGLCRSGARLGYLIGGTCVTTPAPLPTPTPTPTPTVTPTPGVTPPPVTPPPPPPFSIPGGLGVFRLDAVITG